MDRCYTLFYSEPNFEFHKDSPLVLLENKNIQVITFNGNSVFISTTINIANRNLWYKIYINNMFIDIVSNITMRIPIKSNVAIYFIYLIEKLSDDSYDPEAILKKIFVSARYLVSLIANNNGVFDDEMITAILPAKKL